MTLHKEGYKILRNEIIIFAILNYLAYYYRPGNFIPGHGGILDRMDAFKITIPILYILTLYK